jgi:predicted transcriptional regulator
MKMSDARSEKNNRKVSDEIQLTQSSLSKHIQLVCVKLVQTNYSGLRSAEQASFHRNVNSLEIATLAREMFLA